MSFIDNGAIQAVQRGAAFLDEHNADWAVKIDVGNLDMNHCENCVIGQAVGEYYVTISAYAYIDGYEDYDGESWAVNNGFCSPSMFTSDGGWDGAGEEAYYVRLEELWTEEVKKRFN